ncbi:MAG: LptF/LptG family permease [Caulobacterales bacterium]|jgi:lipopolysaccharide export system permease protein
MGKLTAYLLRAFGNGVGLAMGSVLAAIMLIDVVEQMRSVGSRVELTLIQAAQLTLMKAPILVEQTLPFVVLAGMMIGMVQLNRRSELIAMRAAGVSAWRFLTPGIVAAFVLGVGVITLLNPIGARLYDRFETQREALMSQRPGAVSAQREGIWLRQGDADGQMVIQAETVDARAGILYNTTFFVFEFRDGTLRFERRLRAETAELRPGFWQLSNVVEGAPGAAPTSQDKLAIPTTLEASDILERLVSPATLSFWALPGFIAEARTAGMSPLRFEIKWTSLLAYPLLLMAMAALGGVFSLRMQRMGNLAQWGGIGVGLGLALFFFAQVSQALAITQAVPAAVASFAAPLAGLFCAMGIVCFLEDG